ncbi:ATP-binding protein [Balneola sp. MJW-20]|uniref:ATP-binding protein n=1 Tax=Gracilimonas aurantiaca TaxID=3234185 RepID=UPI0034679572
MKIIQTLHLNSTYEEVEKLEGFLNDLQEKLSFDNEMYARLMLTVSEAVTNGIVHGNQLDESKKVHVKAETDDTYLYIVTEDDGDGFNPEDVPDPLAEENLLKPSGRGIFLMEEHADETNFSEDGTILTLKFRL